MDAKTFETYFTQFPVRLLKKRIPVISAGDELQKIFYLKKGYVRLYTVSHDGKELTLIIYRPGDFFPIYPALTGVKLYRYWIETLTPAEIASVPLNSFVSFFKKNPDLLLDLSLRIMERLDGTLHRMEYFAFGHAYAKVASILFILGKRHGKAIAGKNEVLIQVPLTHKDIACLIGITRETVSIEMHNLQKKKLISYKGHSIIIKDMKKLETESLLQPSVES